jgi:hypothetical protein
MEYTLIKKERKRYTFEQIFSRKHIRYFLYSYGMIFMLGCCFMTLTLFFTAYFVPGRTLMFGIDWVKEADIELVLILIGVVCVAYIGFDFKRFLRFIKAGGVA